MTQAETGNEDSRASQIFVTVVCLLAQSVARTLSRTLVRYTTGRAIKEKRKKNMKISVINLPVPVSSLPEYKYARSYNLN